MKKLFIGIILIGAVVGGVFVWLGSQQKVAQGEPKTAPLEKRTIVDRVSAHGKIAPKDLVTVGIDTPVAKIVEVYAGCEVNKPVRQNQALFRLDDTLALARLKEAESALAAAEASKLQAEAKRDTAQAAVNRAEVAHNAASEGLRRQREINVQEQGGIPKAKLAEAEDLVKIAHEGVANAKAAVKEAEAGILAADALILKAKAGVDVARKGVEAMTIIAPIAGTILERNSRVMAGQIVSAQMAPLFVIAPENLQWELYAQVGEYDINKIKMGMPVEFTVDAYSDDNTKFTGTVSRIADLPVNATSARATGDLPAGIAGPVFFTVTVDVDPEKDKPTGKRHPLRAGLSANVDFIVSVKTDVLVLPNAALNYQPENLPTEMQGHYQKPPEQSASVFIWVNGHEELCYVDKGASDGTYTEVKSLKPFRQELKVELSQVRVVIEGPPPIEKGGLFDFKKPIKLPG